MIDRFSKKYILIFVIVLFSLPLNFIPSDQASADSSTGVLIPLYSYPTDIGWDTVYQTKIAHTPVKIIVIINPNNGPGTFKDTNFVFGIQKLQSAGVEVLGYVPTDYGVTDMTTVKANIDKYKIWYSVNGIMFDEMNTTGHETYYYTLSTYAKVNDSMSITVGNPGGTISSSYLGTVDNLTIYEDSGLPSTSRLSSTTAGQDKINFSMVAYAVNADAINQTYVNAASNYVGYLYMTNDILPNPYNKVSSYLMNLVAYLDHCNPPVSGDWIVATSCTLAGNPAISGDVTINPGVVITVPDGEFFNLDFKHHHLLIRSGGGVLIKAGGALK